MFKYIKTIHSHTVAETCKHDVYTNENISKGTLCQLTNGYLVHTADASKPFYLILEDKKDDDGKSTLDCIRLCPGMMLVGTAGFDPSSAGVGTLCGVTSDVYDHYTQISGEGTYFEIVEIDGDNLTVITM